jgi:hypothetical protein
MHLSDGELLTYLDGETLRAVFDGQAHLEQCARCRQRAQSLAERRRWVSQRMDALEPSKAMPALSTRSARQRLRNLQIEKENTPMFKKVFSPSSRPLWIAVALVAVLAVGLAFPPARAIANSFLGLFRVQRIAVVEVSPGDLPQQLGSSSQLEALLAEQVNVEELGETQPANDAAEAASLAGFTVRLPQGMADQPRLEVHPGTNMSFAIDLPRIQAVLEEIGRSDIQLPQELDASTVTVEMKPTVAALYGDCDVDMEEMRRNGYDPDNGDGVPRLPNCITLVQMPSPEVNAPPDLDIVQLGEAYLQLLGLTPEEAAQFADTVDWTSTFIVPIPRYGTSYTPVMVDGVEGTLIQQDLEEHAEQYLLMWVKDGMLYALTGQGEAETALGIAAGLR